MLAKERRIADLPILMLEGKEERERERESEVTQGVNERGKCLFVVQPQSTHTCYVTY